MTLVATVVGIGVGTGVGNGVGAGVGHAAATDMQLLVIAVSHVPLPSKHHSHAST